MYQLRIAFYLTSTKLSWPHCRLQGWTGERDHGVVSFPSLHSWTQNSLGPLFSAGFSGNFGELLRHASLGSQLTKDQSFNSAMFHSLLSQKSDDHAAMVSPKSHIRQGTRRQVIMCPDEVVSRC